VVYVSQGVPDVVVKLPPPQGKGAPSPGDVFQDDVHNCYTLKATEVPCDATGAVPVKEFPIVRHLELFLQQMQSMRRR
jgi:hypothetical protein